MEIFEKRLNINWTDAEFQAADRQDILDVDCGTTETYFYAER